MSKLDTAPYKGVRDFYPEDQFIQNYIFNVWRKTTESFGYEEYSASILEPTEIYTEKSGEEIVQKQTYTFTDRGGREVTLRPEMTPTVARMVAAKQRELGYPLRWYSIPNLFRYEATQRGRLREHWQLNIDIFGISNIQADLEGIEVAYRIMRNFGASDSDFEIRLNYPTGTGNDLKAVIQQLSDRGITNVIIDKELARGQAYYTGVVFEFFDTNKENSRSILGGGRYDNLTELFGGESLPAVGFGAGDVTIKDFLETHGLLPEYHSSTQIYIAVISEGQFAAARQLADELRAAGLYIAVDWSGRKVGDQIKIADKRKIPYIIVLGEDEARSQTYKLKDLKTGEEIVGSVSSLKLELAKKSASLLSRRAEDKAL
ncbi:MAG: histidine--tRNA ligase [Candidatus Zambryskibacteria bacterium]|nr:histidine--tRNA ligase [Candidatus Zambryskibacteria bacterium]